MKRCGWILCLLLAVVGCGGEEDERKPKAEKPKPPTSTLQFVADRKIPLRYTKKTYRTQAGRVELRLTNPSQAVHNVAVEQSAKCCRQPGNKQLGLTDTISPGDTIRGVVELRPGRYWAYCTVEGHWQGGMVSRLLVE